MHIHTHKGGPFTTLRCLVAATGVVARKAEPSGAQLHWGTRACTEGNQGNSMAAISRSQFHSAETREADLKMLHSVPKVATIHGQCTCPPYRARANCIGGASKTFAGQHRPQYREKLRIWKQSHFYWYAAVGLVWMRARTGSAQPQ